MNESSPRSFNGAKDILNQMYALPWINPAVWLAEIGQSVIGYPILAAGIGNGRRRVIFTAAHHGNEWLTGLVLLRFLRELAIRREWQYVLNSNTLIFVPLVNPDGVDIASGALARGYYYDRALAISRNYPAIPFPTGWKANINGVDLNLQYPARWEEAKELKYAAGFVSPAPRDFVGAYPLQAPEAAALAALTENLAPELIIALHSQGEVIYYMSNGYAPEGTFPLVQEMADASGYTLEATPSFSDNAGYKDWFISRFDRPGFTIEMGLGENPLPLSQLDSIYARVAPMLLLAANGK
ncbi:MAG: hypothetical protein LBM18_01225 [Oscillospiraceae bacterium]|jgi:g-D-glutamyl-meso-diaminopimelate peptidase|nr:hypothetical protein [Oscillospiraceae bacterium]